LAEEAVDAQEEANEMDIQAREETQEAREAELESAEEGLEEDFEELVKQEQNPTSDEILKQQAEKKVRDLEDSLAATEEESNLIEFEEEFEELFNDLYKLAVDTDNAFDETQFKQIGAIKNYDAESKDEIIETLINNGTLEEDGATLSLGADDMGEINWKMIKGNLTDCI
jgi:beta-N-acetylglucosaminidase